MKWVIVLLAFTFNLSCSFAEKAEFIELPKLMKNFEKYSGKNIITSGYLEYEPEGYALFLNLDDIKKIKTDQSIWLEFKSQNVSHPLHLKKVIVEGLVDKKNTGHMGLWPGGLRVTCLTKFNKNNTCK